MRWSNTEAYKAVIQTIRDKQEAMIKTGQAATCGTSWSVGESKREGERMVKHYAKLSLRAFNAEFEAAEEKQREREEQRQFRAEQREEERVQKELQRESAMVRC